MLEHVDLELGEDVLKDLERLVPSGLRNRFVNDAVRIQLARLERQVAFDRIEAFRHEGPSTSTEEILEMLRAVRSGDHA